MGCGMTGASDGLPVIAMCQTRSSCAYARSPEGRRSAFASATKPNGGGTER